MQQLLTGPVRRFIHVQSDEIEVYRQGTGDDQQYGMTPDYSSVGTRILAFAGLQESMQPTAAGQNQSRRLIAYSLPDEDIREDDRVYHPPATEQDANEPNMEIVASFGLPNEREPAVIRHELEDA